MFARNRSARGFTLPELIVATAIVGIIALLAGSLVTYVSTKYFEVKERLEANLEAAKAESLLRQYFSQAVDLTDSVSYFGGSETISFGNNSTGEIRNGIDYDQISDMATDWATLAVFLRESSTGLGNPGSTSLKRTAMWYRRPSLTTAGILFIDPGNSGATLQPSYSNPYIDHLSRIKIDKNPIGASSILSSLDITIAIRYHPFSGENLNWCPQKDIASGANGCGTYKTSFKDVERNFRILLQNNLVKPYGTTINFPVKSEQRVMGSLYFFRAIFPLGWSG